MSVVAVAAEALEGALKTVDGLRTYRDPGAAVDPPAVVLGPPALTWEAPCSDPTSARFLIYVVEKADDRVMDHLWDRIPQVAEAVDQVPDAVVRRADPGSYLSGGTELPAYLLEIEVGL